MRSKLSDWLALHRSMPVLLRVAADLVLVNISMALAFAAWFAYYVWFEPATNLVQLAAYYSDLYRRNVALWSVTFGIVFALHGLYTRSRTFTLRHRLRVTLRALAGGLLVFLFVSYLLLRTATIPRGVVATAAGALILFVGGVRMAVALFRQRYRMESRRPARGKRVKVVLVVGGGGYIGSVLVRRLLQRGYRVRVLDCFLYGREALAEIATHPNLEIQEGDFRNIPTVVQAVRGCDAVVHLAAIVGDPACNLDEEIARQINYTATRLLAEVAKGFGVERFLFASTCSVYGASNEILDERSQLNPLSLYARTKMDCEQALLSANADGFCPVVLRLGTAFGLSPRPRFDLAVNLLAARAMTEGTFTIHSGEQWRPFVHVSDIARAFVACLEVPASAVQHEVFNIGSEELNLTLSVLAGKVRQAVPAATVQFTGGADHRNYRVSFAKAERALRFRCERTVEQGIEEICRAFADGRIRDYRDPRYNNFDFLQQHADVVVCRDTNVSALGQVPAYA